MDNFAQRPRSHPPAPRLFHLMRQPDASGTPPVADGVVWPDDSVAIRWRGDKPSTAHCDSLDRVETIDEDRGARHIVWADADDDHLAALDRLRELAEPLRGMDVPAAAVVGASASHVLACGTARWIDAARGLVDAVLALDETPARTR